MSQAVARPGTGKEDRRVARMRAGGRSEKEVARDLGVSTRTVRRRVARALGPGKPHRPRRLPLAVRLLRSTPTCSLKAIATKLLDLWELADLKTKRAGGAVTVEDMCRIRHTSADPQAIRKECVRLARWLRDEAGLSFRRDGDVLLFSATRVKRFCEPALGEADLVLRGWRYDSKTRRGASS